MRELLILAIHLLVTFAKLLRPGGARAVAAESLLLKHQLLISNRSRQRATNLTTLDRFVLGLTTLFVSPRRIAKLGTLVKPVSQGLGRSEIPPALFYLVASPQTRSQRRVIQKLERGGHAALR
jgi:hypothetical protein